MCGICGVALRPPRQFSDRDRLEAMCATLRHRGPDDECVVVAGGAGLAATRLAIIDPAGGRQPVANETGTVWAACNGEIYNYRELRAELLADGHVLASAGDTEVLAHLYESRYEDEGTAMFGRLRGMFAAAVWDAPRRRLVLARDRLGVKPLFWALHDDALVFGSEIKALLAAGLPRRLEPAALHDYLAFDYVPGPRTMFEGVHKLPPAHALVWEDGVARLVRYWDFPVQPEPGALADPGPAELAAELRRRLDEAVRATMVSDVPIGAFLSGGIDSSVVVALMAAASDRPVRTFSVGFRERSYDERPHARTVARHLGTDHTELTIEPRAAEVVHRLVHAFDEPFADSSAIAAWAVSEAAAAHTKVVLSGDGGDEVFGGYVIYQADRLAGVYRRLPRVIAEGLVPAVVDRLPASHAKMSFDLKLRRFVAHARGDPISAHAGWRTIFGPAERDALYAPGFPAARHDPLDAQRAAFASYPGRDLLDRFMVVDSRFSLVDDMLTKVDRTSMAHGLEVRVPLLDHRLVEWMTVLPSRYKVRRLELKHLLRRAAADLLPPSIVRRPKAGFHVPLPLWLNGELRPLVDEVLGESVVARQGVFAPAQVRRLVAEHAAGRRDHSRGLWGLLVFGLWYDRHIGS